MSVKIIDRTTPDGENLKRRIAELCGLEVAVGFQLGASKSTDDQEPDDQEPDVCMVAAWNEFGTSNIPSRPFLRDSVDNHRSEIKSFLVEQKKTLLSGGGVKEILKTVGNSQKDLVQNEILTGNFTPNAPSTIRQKKSSKPLIDTGRMLQSVSFIVRKKGSGEK